MLRRCGTSALLAMRVCCTASTTRFSSRTSLPRLGGIQAMAHLADDWPGQSQRCVDMLCAYVRNAGDEHGVDPNGQDHPSDNAASHSDARRRIVELIVERLTDDKDKNNWSGCTFDFTGAVFDVGDFHDVNFSEAKFLFANAQFRGDVNFAGATFGRATVTFTQASCEPGSEVSFEGAHFNGVQVLFDNAHFLHGSVSFKNAIFKPECNVTFAGADLGRAGFVSFESARFLGGSGQTLKAFEHAHFYPDPAHDKANVTFDLTMAKFKGRCFDFTNIAEEPADYVGGQKPFFCRN